MGWIKKVPPDFPHRCENYFPLSYKDDGVGIGSIWKCDCEKQWKVAEKDGSGFGRIVWVSV
jgi:hypothetical protein